MRSPNELLSLLVRQPRAPLALLPTPVHQLRNLTRHLDSPELWIKRDDLTGLEGGGNKTRKLEYLEIDAGHKPYLIPGGASEHPLGSLGYMGCAAEIVLQSSEHGIRFSHVVRFTGSSSTQAGLVAGFAFMGEDISVIGVADDHETDSQAAKASSPTPSMTARPSAGSTSSSKNIASTATPRSSSCTLAARRRSMTMPASSRRRDSGQSVGTGTGAIGRPSTEVDGRPSTPTGTSPIKVTRQN